MSASDITVTSFGTTKYVTPRDRAHLQQLIAKSLTAMTDGEPEPDEDGDFPLRAGKADIYLRPFEDSPVMEVMAPLITEVSDLEAAAKLVAALNDVPGPFKFSLMEDTISGAAYVATTPFVPEHLEMTISIVAGMVDDLEDDLAEQVSGTWVVGRDEA